MTVGTLDIAKSLFVEQLAMRKDSDIFCFVEGKHLDEEENT